MNHRFTPIDIYPNNKNLVMYRIVQNSWKGLEVGIMSLIFLKGGEVIYLDEIIILPDYRGVGIGTEILLKLIDFGKRFGSKRIFLSVDANNTMAQSLYKRLGFKFNGKVDPEHFCYEMEYSL